MSFCIVKLVLVHFRYVRASQRYGNYHPPISPLKTVSLFAISYDASGFGYMCHFCNRICTFPNHIFSEVSQPSLKVLFCRPQKTKIYKIIFNCSILLHFSALWSVYFRGIQQSALYFTIIHYKKSFISLPKLDTKLENVKFILVAIVLNLHTFFTKTFFLLVEKYRYQNVCVEFYTSVHNF